MENQRDSWRAAGGPALADSDAPFTRQWTKPDRRNRANPVPNARFLIQDGIVKQVWSGDAAVQAPAGIQVVDAPGKFIIPGLIDSHVHYAWYEGELFLSHGVTSVFDLGGGRWPGSLQKAINSGE